LCGSLSTVDTRWRPKCPWVGEVLLTQWSGWRRRIRAIPHRVSINFRAQRALEGTISGPPVGPYDGAVALVDLAVAFVDLLASRVAERIMHRAAYSRSGHFVFSIFVTVN
jgi:hypothetical protein